MLPQLDHGATGAAATNQILFCRLLFLPSRVFVWFLTQTGLTAIHIIHSVLEEFCGVETINIF